VGEIYLYVDPTKQVPEYCQISPTSYCNPEFGDSIGKGSFRFSTGRWNKLTQVITLNDLGKTNGKLKVLFNGKQVIYFDKMVWQGNTSVPFVGLDFTTFFGGSDSTWATPTTQYTYFRKFYISYTA
jgi:hypothetical protein